MKNWHTILPGLLITVVAWRGASAQCPGILPAIRWTSVGTQVVFEDVTELYGLPAGRTWSFGDGTQSTGPVAYHTFYSTGSDTVQLDLFVAGCTYRLRAPVAHGDNDDVCLTAMLPDLEVQQPANNTLSLTNTSQSPGMPMFAAWDHGDGSIALSSGSSHTYLLPGLYAVTLNMAGTDPGTLDGCVAGMCRTVPVAGNASTCDTLLFVNATVSGLGALDVLLAGTAQPLSGDLVLDQLMWDPGDSTLPYVGSEMVYHNYPSPGTYLACFHADAHLLPSGAACWAVACATYGQEQLVGLKEPDTSPASITAWPNPFEDRLEVHIPPGSQWQWRLLDLCGRPTAHAGTLHAAGGALSLPGLAAGCYALALEGGGRRQVVRLMKR